MKTSIRRPGHGAACRAVFVSLCALAGAAQAQWAWRDASGNITYSDAPPPSDVQPTSILQQPAVPTAADLQRSTGSGSGGSYMGGSDTGGGESAPAPAAARPAPAPSRTVAEQEAEFRKRAADREKAAQKAEQEESQASERASSCAQAKGYLQVIESGARLMRPDSEGNRNFMDEEQRAAETQKAQDNIAKFCS